uniref:Alpha-galactosidase n=1 Tax=Romanomermis culicivorax TaxID=13658 RepID=A0A915HQH7_ROMCU
MYVVGWLIFFFAQYFYVYALNNGLALKPPMGWLSWTRFMCQVDCKKYPDGCISEKLFTEMADVMANEGYRDVGYIQVNLDDCWMSRKRDSNSRLTADAVRFPHGIKWLAEYMHNRGLKLGIYENYGKKTCMGFPGSEDFMEIDAETFADWDVDMFKFDGCFNDPTKLNDAYPEMGRHLNKTGRNIVYGCSWPYYIRTELKQEPDYKAISKSCNLWRNFDDIQIHWKSIESIIKFYDEHQDHLSIFHGPGHWNDPDMIIIGNPGLTVNQCKAQMALWSIWSAPLLMSNDLRDIKPEFREILLNSKVIAIDQDPLGIMGKKIGSLVNGKVSVYKKKLSKKDGEHEHPHAMVFLNLDEFQVKRITFKLEDYSFAFKKGYLIDDLFAVQNEQSESTPIFLHLKIDEQIEISVPPTGVVMWRLETDRQDATVIRKKMDDRIMPAQIHNDQLLFGDGTYHLMGIRFKDSHVVLCIPFVLFFVYIYFRKSKFFRLKRFYRKL